MSHFCVAVFSNEPDDVEFDKLLLKYDENNENEKRFYEVSEEQIQREYDRFVEQNYPVPFEDFLENFGYFFDEELGAYGYRENPNAKYDYYSLDARYPYLLYEDVEFDVGDNPVMHRKNDYDYEKETGDLTPYAFVTPDGEWHAPGTVGWFASSDETEESTAAYEKEWEEYINSEENPYVSFVDCHI